MEHGEIFPSLQVIEYFSDGNDSTSPVYEVFLGALRPSVKTVIFDPRDHWEPHICLVMDKVVEFSKELVEFRLFCYGCDIALINLERRLESMRNLETLDLDEVRYTLSLIRCISSLPYLRKLFSTRSPDFNPSALVSESLACRSQATVFGNLETLALVDAVSVINGFLSLIPYHSRLLHLDITLEEIGSDDDSSCHQVFQSSFAPRSLEYLRIWSHLPLALEDAFRSNIFRAIGRLHSLRHVNVSLRHFDEQLVAALRNCSNLEILWLRTVPYVQPGNANRLGLDCLVPILSHCPHLRRIEGCFDLDQERIPLETKGVSPVHLNLTGISLGGSYFSTVEPPNWVPPTVGYLSSLSRLPCEIELGVDAIMVEGIEEAEREARRLKRLQSLREFRICVDAVNSMKRRMLSQG